MSKYRILAIDGGGIRGIIPATVLTYLEERIKEITKNDGAKIADYFDLIVGTSTGGILTSFYLTSDNVMGIKYSASDAIDFYGDYGKYIFADKKIIRLGVAKYSPNNLTYYLNEVFGDALMSSLNKSGIITSFNLINRNPIMFNSREPETKQREYYVRDVIRSTTAAPTYFSPALIRNLITDELMINIDGGIFANNPTLYALQEARKKWSGATLNDIMILSVGTGGDVFDAPKPHYSTLKNLLKWRKVVSDIFMAGAVDVVHEKVKKMFEGTDGHYLRIDVPLIHRKYNHMMDDTSPANMDKLFDAAAVALELAINEDNFNDFIELLTKN